MPDNRFQLQGRAFLLTYPQNSATKEDLLNHLKLIFKHGEYFIVCQEAHEDGSPHLHAVIVCSKRCNIKSRSDGSHPCDFNGKGNYQSCRSIQDSITYVKKDGNFIEEGQAPTPKRKWSELVDTTSKEEFMAKAMEISPRDYFLNLERLEYAANAKFKPALPSYTSQFTFSSIPPIVQQWLDQLNEVRPKSLILWGPTRTGKTALARSLGQHMYFNGLFNIDDWNPDAKYAIFDDFFDWSKFSQYKQWLGAQHQFTATDKYRKKRTLIWGKPCILLSNQLPGFGDMDWVRSNCFILNVMGPLF